MQASNMLQDSLKKHFGFSNFKPKQEEIIQSVMDNHNTFVIMPTGGGKSICFQVPALAKEGVCLVVSPLIALMKDQVYNLQRRNIKAEAIFSGMSKRQIERILDNCMLGKVKFLYLSPERLENEVFQARLQNMNVCLVAIDEAHCISQWGHDFRPEFRNINTLKKLYPKAAIGAYTATATKDVLSDIATQLGLEKASVHTASMRRPNLSYEASTWGDTDAEILQFAQSTTHHESGLVYVKTECFRLSSAFA